MISATLQCETLNRVFWRFVHDLYRPEGIPRSFPSAAGRLACVSSDHSAIRPCLAIARSVSYMHVRAAHPPPSVSVSARMRAPAAETLVRRFGHIRRCHHTLVRSVRSPHQSRNQSRCSSTYGPFKPRRIPPNGTPIASSRRPPLHAPLTVPDKALRRF